MTIEQNILINQGATFQANISLTDANNNPLSVGGYTSQAQLRIDYDSSNAFSFTTSLSLGLLSLNMTANTTATIPPGRYVYDVILLSNDGTVIRIAEGVAEVSPGVTQWTTFDEY